VLAFATSALRDAGSHRDVVERVRDDTGVVLRMLPGEDEARYTFLAARRWFGWSAGRLLVVDIGGGSLELAAGRDEDPDVAESLPLGAGRLTRDSFTSDPPSSREIAALAERIEPAVAAVADRVCAAGAADCVVGTSKTLRSLARLTGAAPSGAGPRVPRVLTRRGAAPASRVHPAGWPRAILPSSTE
jgi:exopolyphosphatase/guanosine-5'-triphosphate,3'-diphosphate pyrophosphatase